MTSIVRTDVTCGACGHVQSIPTLVSTSRSGHPDLDGRPSGHARSTMHTWARECTGCHVVTGDLAKARPRGAVVAATDAYQAELHHAQRDALANRFVCQALVAEDRRDFIDAAWARLHAAWVCDDRDHPAEALAQRTIALVLFDRVPAPPDKRIERLAVTVDIARRAGDHPRAIALAAEGLGLADDKWRGYFHLQHTLATAGDVACHTWAEVPLPPQQIVEAPAPAEELATLDEVRDAPALAPHLVIAGESWDLVDELNVLDKESEERHAFAIRGAKDSYRARQKLRYPDGTTVEDIGRAHVDGVSTFRVTNLVPGRALLILRRLDYVYGDYELAMRANGIPVGTSSVAGTDRQARWRNWPFVIPAQFVTEPTLTIEQVATTEGRDVNLFHLWFYQRSDGAPAVRAPFIALGDRPGIRSLFNFAPDTARPLCELAEAMLRGPSSLSRGERELIAAYVSHLNDCRYCTGSHSAYAAAQLPGGHDFVAAVKADPAAAGASPKLVALLAIAHLVQQGGRQVTQQAIDAARAQGATDREVHDTVLIAAAFCMYNRYVDGLRTTPLADPAGYDAMAEHIVAKGYVGIS